MQIPGILSGPRAYQVPQDLGLPDSPSRLLSLRCIAAQPEVPPGGELGDPGSSPFTPEVHHHLFCPVFQLFGWEEKWVPYAHGAGSWRLLR